MLPADLVRRPALRTAGLLNLLLGLWNGGEMLVLSLYLQQVLKDSPLATGLVIAPQGVIGFTAGAFGARLASRIGVRRVLVLTGVIAAVGFAVLTQLPASGHYSPVFAAVMLVGFGTAGTAFGTMVIATSGVAGAEQGIVGGVINTSRQIGAALGAALLPAISAAVSNDAVVATARGTRAAMLAAAIASAAAAIIAWRGARTARPGPGAGSALVTSLKSAAQPVLVPARVTPVGASSVHATRAPDVSSDRQERRGQHRTRPHQPAGLQQRLWHLAAPRGLGAHRRAGGDHGQLRRSRPSDGDLDHLRSLPARRS